MTSVSEAYQSTLPEVNTCLLPDNSNLLKLDLLQDNIYEFRSISLRIVIDVYAKLMYSEWVSIPSKAEYAEGAFILSSLIQDKQIEYWIQDRTNLNDIPLNEQKESIHAMAPLLAVTGIKKIALISNELSDKPKISTAIEHKRKEFSSACEIQQFLTYREATHWIEHSPILM